MTRLKPDLYLDNMWKIREINHENRLLNQIHLYSNRMSCKIFPNLGGSLQQMKIDNIDLIDGISADEKGLEDYKNTFKSSILFPFPNRIKDGRYEFGEKSYQLDINDTYFGNAIHGLVYDQSFTISKELSNPEKARLEMKFKSEGKNPGYPFSYELVLIYEFWNKGEANLTFKVNNLDHRTIPFGMGWHPYFVAGNLAGSSLSIPAADHFICPEKMIPEEKEEAQLESSFLLEDKRFDDGYSLVKPNCYFETEAYRLEMTFDTGKESFLQIYTPEHRQSIAIEPMTCVTDAFNNGIGLEAIDSGTEYQWTIQMRFETKS